VVDQGVAETNEGGGYVGVGKLKKVAGGFAHERVGLFTGEVSVV
jgi:hypothetical protein